MTAICRKYKGGHAKGISNMDIRSVINEPLYFFYISVKSSHT